jgi:hypothetical protein
LLLSHRSPDADQEQDLRFKTAVSRPRFRSFKTIKTKISRFKTAVRARLQSFKTNGLARAPPVNGNPLELEAIWHAEGVNTMKWWESVLYLRCLAGRKLGMGYVASGEGEVTEMAVDIGRICFVLSLQVACFNGIF